MVLGTAIGDPSGGFGRHGEQGGSARPDDLGDRTLGVGLQLGRQEAPMGAEGGLVDASVGGLAGKVGRRRCTSPPSKIGTGALRFPMQPARGGV